MSCGIASVGGGGTCDVGTVEIRVENGNNDWAKRIPQNEMKSS